MVHRLILKLVASGPINKAQVLPTTYIAKMARTPLDCHVDGTGLGRTGIILSHQRADKQVGSRNIPALRQTQTRLGC
jgi:hypothetical protein